MVNQNDNPIGNETCPAELPNFCAQRHWSIFWILIICSVSSVAGRAIVVGNHSDTEDTPFFSANDRSRWSTIRALGDEGTYQIDSVIRDGQAIRWDSIDKVRHLGTDGELHFYSSKPTLLPTMMSGVYLAIKAITGKNLADDTTFVARLMLLVVNVIPWALFLFFLAKTINAVPVRDWTRYYVLACGGFGTFLSTFSNSINNHVPAAIAVMIALYLIAEMWRKSDTSLSHYFFAGLFAAFAVASELPALSFFGVAALLCLIRSPKNTLVGFLPSAIMVAAGVFGTNFLAHGQLQPAYNQRGDGDQIAELTGEFDQELNSGRLPAALQKLIEPHHQLTQPTVVAGDWPSTPKNWQRWVVRDRASGIQFAIVKPSDESPYQVRQWGNWYEYPGSYWLASNFDRKSKVDRGQASVPIYAFHVLFGHHGIFSLTPIWLFSLAGMVALAGGVKLAGRFQMRWLGLMGLVVSIVVVGFYLRRPEIDRNYGGVTSALRWLFWLAPIWLVSMLPVVDWLAKTRWGKFTCYALLAISAVSALYSANNPWVHPWLYEVWDLTGLPR